MPISRRRLVWLMGTGGAGAAAGLWRLTSTGTSTDASPTADRSSSPTQSATPTPTTPRDASEAGPGPAPTTATSATPSPDETGAPEASAPPASEPPSDPPTDDATQPTPPPDQSEPPSEEPTPQEPTPQEPTPDQPTPSSPPPSATGARDIICRDALGIPPGTEDGRPHTPTRLMLHHTAVSSTSASQAPDRLRGHTRYHQQQGWPTIAYHYGVDLRGNLYELRDVNIAGDTFTAYEPAGWFLVVCEGDFNSTQPTDRLLDGVATMFAHGAAVFGIDPATLAGHRDHASTTCPGDLLYAHRDALVAEVQRRLGAGGTALPRICGDEADRRVDAIESGED